MSNGVPPRQETPAQLAARLRRKHEFKLAGAAAQAAREGEDRARAARASEAARAAEIDALLAANRARSKPDKSGYEPELLPTRSRPRQRGFNLEW